MRSIKRDMKLNDGDMSFVSSDNVDYDWIEQVRSR